MEEEMWKNYADLFARPLENFGDKILLRERGYDDPEKLFSHFPTNCIPI